MIGCRLDRVIAQREPCDPFQVERADGVCRGHRKDRNCECASPLRPASERTPAYACPQGCSLIRAVRRGRRRVLARHEAGLHDELKLGRDPIAARFQQSAARLRDDSSRRSRARRSRTRTASRAFESGARSAHGPQLATTTPHAGPSENTTSALAPARPSAVPCEILTSRSACAARVTLATATITSTTRIRRR